MIKKITKSEYDAALAEVQAARAADEARGFGRTCWAYTATEQAWRNLQDEHVRGDVDEIVADWD